MESNTFGEWEDLSKELDEKVEKQFGATPAPFDLELIHESSQKLNTALARVNNHKHTTATATNNLNNGITNSDDANISNNNNNFKSQTFQTRKQNAEQTLIATLKEACTNNLGGINQESWYVNHQGKNDTIHTHAITVKKGIERVCQGVLTRSILLEYLHDLNRTYGRSALCLSGGAGNGYYHVGVIKCLWENGLLPDIITGSSAGSLIGALVCCRTDLELQDIMSPQVAHILTACEGSLLSKILRWFETGYVFDTRTWQEKLKHVTLGYTTFKEAYERTGRILNITVFDGGCHSQVLNYITSPNVVIMSAVLASSSIPHLLPSQQLLIKARDGVVKPHHALGKFWRDGSFHGDLPIKQLHQMFNVNYTIVSQVEPHIIPWLSFEPRGSAGWPTTHRSGWQSGYAAAFAEHFLRLDLYKWLRVLRDFDLLPDVFGTNWSHIFLQHMNGTCTIVPPFRVSDWFRLMQDPGVSGMTHYMHVGQQMTWRKLHMIRNFRMIEIALAHAIAQHQNQHNSRVI